MYCIAERVVLPPLKEEERTGLLEKAALLRYHLNFSGREKSLMWRNPCGSDREGEHL
jgi:hypothetical protein